MKIPDWTQKKFLIIGALFVPTCILIGLLGLHHLQEKNKIAIRTEEAEVINQQQLETQKMELQKQELQVKQEELDLERQKQIQDQENQQQKEADEALKLAQEQEIKQQQEEALKRQQTFQQQQALAVQNQPTPRSPDQITLGEMMGIDPNHPGVGIQPTNERPVGQDNTAQRNQCFQKADNDYQSAWNQAKQYWWDNNCRLGINPDTACYSFIGGKVTPDVAKVLEQQHIAARQECIQLYPVRNP